MHRVRMNGNPRISWAFSGPGSITTDVSFASAETHRKLSLAAVEAVESVLPLEL